MPTLQFSRAAQTAVLIAILIAVSACSKPLPYVETAIADRRANMLGVETLFLQYLNAHPEQFSAFINILTDADDALQSHKVITRAGVVRWIDRQTATAGFDERNMPGLFFLKHVYLAGWSHSYLHFLDENDREFLSDLISGVMAAPHKCQTCSTAGAHHDGKPRHGRP
jgi:hypothetical protein